MSQPSYWPSMVDYQEAIQCPRLAFTSSELQYGTPVANQLGLPRPLCGTFASVYELASGRRRWAVKCFLRNIPNLQQRYARISEHLRYSPRLRYFVTEYQPGGILVRGKSFPLVKMEWVKGRQLNTFIEQNLSRPRVLGKLKKRWGRLLTDLQSVHIAHGDLQHGNVLVRPNGDLRLIDYDGMWVPTLGGQEGNETGHPDYQNPGRTQKDFHAGIDEFSDAVIQIAICALRREPSLWEKYNNGDNLLFRREDFLNPRSSSLIADLGALGDHEITEKLEFVIEACPGSTPGPRKADSRAPAPASRLGDHVEDSGGFHPKDTARGGKLTRQAARWRW